jgi:hypothetical protein
MHDAFCVGIHVYPDGSRGTVHHAVARSRKRLGDVCEGFEVSCVYERELAACRRARRERGARDMTEHLVLSKMNGSRISASAPKGNDLGHARQQGIQRS